MSVGRYHLFVEDEAGLQGIWYTQSPGDLAPQMFKAQ